MSKALVAYFSASGTTARVAKSLAAATDADLFQIEPAAPYTRADLNWNDKSSRSSKEMGDEGARPAIASSVTNMAEYDVVYVGFPVWWYVEPRIIDTFLESYDFADKTIVPFATSGGSGIGRASVHMQGIVPSAKVQAGGLLNGRPSAAKLASWAKEALR